jgi:hypothetical protein
LGLDTPKGPSEEESVLTDIDTEVDSRWRDERRKRELVEFCAEEDEELRVGVCTGVVCDWRLKAPRRGRRIFRDGVFGVVFGVIAAAEGGVEGRTGREGTGSIAAEGMGAADAGVCMEAGAAGFCLTMEIGSFLSLSFKLREFRPASTGLGSDCTFY